MEYLLMKTEELLLPIAIFTTPLLGGARNWILKGNFLGLARTQKKIWQVINNVRNIQSNKSSEIESIKVDGKLVSDKQDICNLFNKHFAQVGKKVSSTVLQTQNSYHDFLPPACPKSMFFEPVSPYFICDTINSMLGKQSCDINGVSISLIKEVANEISEPLAHIYNLSIEHGIFPTGMKVSKTIPIFKNVDSRQNMNNYRGISIINCFSKVFEKIVSDRLVKFLTYTEFFNDKQFGFLRGRSCNHAVLQIVNSISERLNKGEITIGIFLDVQKAFDCVDHSILCAKLENAGIRGKVLDWFKSYLSERKQKVVIGNYTSDSLEDIDMSVLQGSILGVVLFLVFINDIQNCSDELYSTLFADDVTSLISGSNLTELQIKTNRELVKLFNWYKANKLAIHPSKSKCMIFKPKFINLNLPKVNGHDYLPIFLNYNNEGECNITKINLIRLVPNSDETAVRVLGIFIDEHLTLNEHVSKVRSKIARSLYSLNQVRNYLNKDLLRNIYFAHIHSHINYCNNLFTMASSSTINQLFLIQKRAIRIISKARARSHTSKLFLENGILPLQRLIDYNVLMFMYDLCDKKHPKATQEWWVKNYHRIEHDYELRTGNNFYIPRLKYKYYENLPLYSFATKWNNFRLQFKSTFDKSCFRQHLQDYLFYVMESKKTTGYVCPFGYCAICAFSDADPVLQI